MLITWPRHWLMVIVMIWRSMNHYAVGQCICVGGYLANYSTAPHLLLPLLLIRHGPSVSYATYPYSEQLTIVSTTSLFAQHDVTD
jgi:Zn-dependent protease with chaperone function